MSEENIENVKSGNNFASIFADHHLLSDINFNGQCLINSIYIPSKYIYFLPTKSMVKKFKHRFYIKWLLVCICKAN